MRSRTISLLVCLILLGCQRATFTKMTAADVQPFIGKTVGELLDARRVTLAQCEFIDDPPGVLAELSFPAGDGRYVRLALDRHSSSLFSEQRKWSADAVRQAKIVEARYVDRR